MLKRQEIEDLVRLRLPEDRAKEMLLSLSSDRLDVRTIRLFLDVMRETLEGDTETLRRLGAAALDCCGTGGSGAGKYNVSTTVAFVLAAGGVKVSKFGNRSASGKCGSFDLLEALGFPLNVPGNRQADIFDETGLALLFAPQFYPELSALGIIRRTLGVKTIFNFIGPLLNPMKPAYRVLGVSDASVQVLLASVISQDPSSKRCLMVRGQGDLDEISDQGTTQLYDVKDGKVDSTRFIAPQVPQDETNEVTATDQDARVNATVFVGLLSGDGGLSRYRRQVCLNAGAGFYIMGKAPSIEKGADVAEGLLQSGEVRAKFEHCRRAYASVFA